MVLLCVRSLRSGALIAKMVNTRFNACIYHNGVINLHFAFHALYVYHCATPQHSSLLVYTFVFLLQHQHRICFPHLYVHARALDLSCINIDITQNKNTNNVTLFSPILKRLQQKKSNHILAWRFYRNCSAVQCSITISI